MAGGICKWVVRGYGVLALLALAIIPASSAGWFGMEPDALSGVFAILLAAPWSFLFSGVTNELELPWSRSSSQLSYCSTSPSCG